MSRRNWLEGNSWRLKSAAEGLKRKFPEYSAALPSPKWQKTAVLSAVASIVFLSWLLPTFFPELIFVVLAIAFLMITLLRALALGFVVLNAPTHGKQSDEFAHMPSGAELSSLELPVYTVLLPVFNEAEIIADLLAAIDGIDYPRDKLDVLLILEDVDRDTQAAVSKLSIPYYVRVITVPDGQPRTKPRALNYAMTFARGSYVVVYDAEDIPQPNQLKRAVLHFRSGSEDLACLQAELRTYNANESWLAGQFTIEYATLFGAILPAMERLGLPIPLGGTSNHFRRHILAEVGGWDPYNVTEDADLGLRLARCGWRVGILDSTTWEEAPRTFRVWLCQRTRWLKGWMQTYRVQMRSPEALYRELGLWQFVGFQILMGGLILSALIHPWFFVYCAVSAISEGRDVLWQSVQTSPLFWMGGINLCVGYAVAIILGAAVMAQKGMTEVAWRVIGIPFYWLVISMAAYRALWQVARQPFLWEKTPHRARRGEIALCEVPCPESGHKNLKYR